MVLKKSFEIAFVILAHDQIEWVAEHANMLAKCGNTVVIHFDKRSGEALVELLRELTINFSNQIIFAERVECAWGEFSLVQAELNCLSKLREIGWLGNYVYLLSGADVPIRPIKQLKDFLIKNEGLEFIEAVNMHGEKWVGGGLNQERYQYRFPFNERTQRKLFYSFFNLQRALGLKRKFYKDLIPHVGSQWSCITWESACFLLESFKDQKLVDFSSSVWIPDEMIKQSLLANHLESDKIVGKSPTYYRFSDYGKPIVFYDDHEDYLTRQNFFFARKTSPNAQKLRTNLLKLATSRKPQSELFHYLFGIHDSEYEMTRINNRDKEKGRRVIGKVSEKGLDELDNPAKKIIACKITHPKIANTFTTSINREKNIIFHNDLFSEDKIEFAENSVTFGGLHNSQTSYRNKDTGKFLSTVLRQKNAEIIGYTYKEKQLDQTMTDLFSLENCSCIWLVLNPLIEVFARSAKNTNTSHKREEILRKIMIRNITELRLSESIDQKSKKASDRKVFMHNRNLVVDMRNIDTDLSVPNLHTISQFTGISSKVIERAIKVACKQQNKLFSSYSRHPHWQYLSNIATKSLKEFNDSSK